MLRRANPSMVDALVRVVTDCAEANGSSAVVMTWINIAKNWSEKRNNTAAMRTGMAETDILSLFVGPVAPTLLNT